MPHQPVVTLTDDERATLERFVHRGNANARTLTRARILLKSAEGWSHGAASFAVVHRARCFTRGWESAGGSPWHSSPGTLAGGWTGTLPPA